LLEIVRGLTAGVAGEALPAPPAETQELRFDAIHQELSQYRYCTVFVVEGEDLDADALERELELLGDSLLVVGDPTALKVHVHTDDPGAALSLGSRAGVIEGIEIANMHEQTREREERLESVATALDSLPTLQTGVVAVVPGRGNRRLFESLKATRVIEGGQTMNPSTSEIHAAVEATPAASVIVLPNNSNVVLTAEQAAALASKPVHVLPTTTVQAGLAALVAYDPERALDENVDEMWEAQESVATGEVTRASRDVELDGIEVRKASWLGLANGRAIASGDDLDGVVDAVVVALLAGERGLLTILTGDDAPDMDRLLARLAEAHPGIEIEVHQGDQPHYPLLLSAE
jgi:DAK2 domain fusion protein YloV